MEASNGAKRVFCYCHFGGELIENNDDRSIHYKGGRTVGIIVTSSTTFSEFIAQLQRKLELESCHINLKYALEFNKMQLLELMSEEDMWELVNFSEKYANVYIFSTKDSTGNFHCEEQPQEKSTAKYSSGNDVELSNRDVLNKRDSPILLDKSNLTISCTDTDQHVVESELWKNDILGAGQTFKNADTFRNALYRYGIAHKFSYNFLKNTTHTMRVRCSVEGCPWRLNANQVGETDFLKVGTFISEHSHSAQDIIDAKPKVNSKLAVSIISTKLRMQPETTPNQIKASFSSELKMDINYKQAWRLKEQSMRIIHGMPDESYRLIPWLCNRIMEADEHAVATYEASSDHRFVKVFVAYGCSIVGFLLGCHPIIYIDGCHLSGPYRGTLLSATTFYANNRMFPLAYAIVSSEKYEDWHWFLIKLKEITSSMDVTIISDRHHNILSSVAQIFGRENHAYCYRHIKENFSAEVSKLLPWSKLAKENALKLLDAVMYARLDIDLEAALKNLRSFKSELADWVLQNQPEQWVMSKFAKRRWDQVTTNVAESFNAWMLKERRHYVFALMNEHRDKLARKLLKAKDDLKTWKNGVGPNIEDKLLENIARGEIMIVTPYGQYSAKVSTGYANLKVNLAMQTCTCLGWQMPGIPCPHACATIKNLKGNLYDYVEDWYQIHKQELIYSNLMVPIETHDMPKERPDAEFTLDTEDEEFLIPPTTKRPPGRPKVKRIESQFMKKRRVHCSQCGEAGHNRASCRNPNPS